jgi:hypothetical protein
MCSQAQRCLRPVLVAPVKPGKARKPVRSGPKPSAPEFIGLAVPISVTLVPISGGKLTGRLYALPRTTTQVWQLGTHQLRTMSAGDCCERTYTFCP